MMMPSRKLLLRVITIAAPVVLVVVIVLNFIGNAQSEHPGKAVYKSQCASCHGDNGEGVRSLVPSFTTNNFAAQNFDSIPCWIRHGLARPLTINDTVFDIQPMYPLPIDEVQIANVMNYMASEMLHTERRVTSGWVKQQLSNCK